MKKPQQYKTSKKMINLKKRLICTRTSIKNDQERLDTRLFLVPKADNTKSRFPVSFLPLCNIQTPLTHPPPLPNQRRLGGSIMWNTRQVFNAFVKQV